jgi:glycosyltransferase involved in cell wall biosynthesis
MGKYCIPRNATLILTVARLGKQKAHEVLLQAIPSITAKHSHVYFLWLGEGEERETLARQLQESGLSSRVAMPGYSSEVRDWLYSCDLFVLPTHYEGLPFSLVEAMAAGCPIAASAVSSIPEVLEQGAAGKLVPDNTPAAWATAINQLLDNPDEMAALGERAKARAARYSEDTMVGETLSLLSQLAEGKIA